MNNLEYVDFKYIEEHSEDKINTIKRQNLKEVNIILGIFYIIIYSFLICIILSLITIVAIIHDVLRFIYKLFVSKCDIQEEE